MTKRADIFIGIDPGVETGYAVWCRSRKQFTELVTLSFWTAYDRIVANEPANVEIFIENPDLLPKALYRRTGVIEHPLMRERMAKNVGSNRREASLLIERLQALGYTVTAVRPMTARKWTAEQFARYTRHEGRTSQHVRDAGRLVFGL
jgi:hypothetical protein